MAEVTERRMTHAYDGELVVFHIGMRLNKPWRVDQWMPVFLAMPRMLAELARDKESGFLGAQLLFGRDGPFVVQYWNSLDKLYAYASEQNAEHRPAWTTFNRMARKAPGAVGIWHETFGVSHAESIYLATPVMGLAKATGSIPIGSNADRARQRYEHGKLVA